MYGLTELIEDQDLELAESISNSLSSSGEAVCLGYKFVIREGDALNVILPLQNSLSFLIRLPYSEQCIAAKTKLILNSFFDWTINHKYREGNINHNVAKWAFFV